MYVWSIIKGSGSSLYGPWSCVVLDYGSGLSFVLCVEKEKVGVGVVLVGQQCQAMLRSASVPAKILRVFRLRLLASEGMQASDMGFHSGSMEAIMNLWTSAMPETMLDRILEGSSNSLWSSPTRLLLSDQPVPDQSPVLLLHHLTSLFVKFVYGDIIHVLELANIPRYLHLTPSHLGGQVGGLRRGKL
ncbi:hypothetical protein INR49_024302 [Caranx melampygus]|nr:hypothetical protein INR49_024302 [Caranx melampygus]